MLDEENMDDATFQAVRQTIILNENRMAFAALEKVLAQRNVLVTLPDLRAKQGEQALHEVDGWWIVPDWWK